MPIPRPLPPLIGWLVGMLVCIRVLADASPPDPSWIGGFWDDGDYDSLILHIGSHLGGAEIVPGYSVQAHWMSICAAPLDNESLVSSPVIPRHLPRGPPLA